MFITMTGPFAFLQNNSILYKIKLTPDDFVLT